MEVNKMEAKAFFKVVTVVLFFVAMATYASAQGVGFSGTIKGIVTDANGNVVSNATVTITDAGTGFRRTAQTNDQGEFQVIDLPPATYTIQTAAKGFQTESQKDISLSIGQILFADFHLKVSGAVATVDVTTEPPLVDTGQPQQANTIGERYIRDLPINRRDYLTYTLLAPGVSDSTRLASDQDFRVKQTPQSGLSFYGSNGRGNNVTIDGGETNDDSGGVRGNLSQDAVNEFQINRSNYAAELGGASGATINIVSKSGTNKPHGSVFGYFRNQRLDARNPFSISQALAPGTSFSSANPDSFGVPVKDLLSRQQYGAAAGFALKQDKSFMFIAFEGLRQNAQNAVPILTNTSIFRTTSAQNSIIAGLTALGATPVPCLTGQPALPAATCAGIINNALTINSATSTRNAYIVNQFENNGGIFPFNTRGYQFSDRFDTRVGDNNQIFVRYNYAFDNENNPDVQSLTGFSRGSSVKGVYHTIEGAWFHQFNSNLSNEARLQYSHTNFRVAPNVFGSVGLDIPGFGNFGNQIFIPNFSILKRYEFADNVTLVHGDHIFKFGGSELIRGNVTESHTFFPGRFVFGSLPGGVLSPCLQVPAACGLTTPAATINSIQAVSLGAPQFYQQGFGNPFYTSNRPFTAFFGQDTWNIRRNFTFTYGARYEIDSQYGNLRTDKNNIAPRVAFSWDPFGDHKTVIRAGYGLFYSQVYAQIPNVVQTLGNVNGNRQIANILVPLTGVPGNAALTSAAIFQTLFAQGKVQCVTPAAGQQACITPADLAQFGITISNSGALPPLTVLFSAQSDYQNPVSQQFEVGIEREIAPGFSISGSFIHVHTTHLPVAIDTNLLPAPFVVDPNTGASIRQWSTSAGFPCAGAGIFNCFRDPTILQNNQYSSIASALYNGLIIEFKGRMSKYASIFGSYTLSKSRDDSLDFNSDYSPVDQTNLAGERALSDFDQRHKIVVAAVLQYPMRNGSGSFEKFMSGFQLSPIVRYNSGHPFNLLAGTNVNNDRHSTNDRPGGAGRNTGLGPNYFAVDMRLSRRFAIGEKAHIEVLAEGFNLFNRTNYASVNNVVGDIPGPYNLRGNRNLSPSSPLGFTSSFPKRQFQLGAKFTF